MSAEHLHLILYSRNASMRCCNLKLSGPKAIFRSLAIIRSLEYLCQEKGGGSKSYQIDNVIVGLDVVCKNGRVAN